MASSISNRDLNFRLSEPTTSRKRSTPEGGQRVEHSVTKVAHSIRHPSEAVEVDSSEFNVVMPLPPLRSITNPPSSHRFQRLEAPALPSLRKARSPILYRIKEIKLETLSKNTFNFVRKYVHKKHIRTEDALYFKNKKPFYRGETKHGIPHGTGTMYLSLKSASGKISNIVIAGKFFEGKPHGYAVLTDPQKLQYKGHFENGLRHGKGTLTTLKGDKYVGEFKNDQFDGTGELTTASGDIYKGGFKAGLYHGLGTLILTSSSDKKAFYVGEFKDGRYDGKGKLITSLGEFYIGEFREDLYHGEGALTTPAGVKYEGTFEAGKKHGRGVEKSGSEYTYNGEFANDYFHGDGTLTLPTRVYIGQFEVGKAHGRGTSIYSDKMVHNGDYQFGHCHGYGTMTLPNGRVFSGSWDEGNYVGFRPWTDLLTNPDSLGKVIA